MSGVFVRSTDNKYPHYVYLFMKKTLIIIGLLTLTTLGSCARKGACPAYGNVQKPATTHARV